MKRCPKCKRVYDDDLYYCLQDRARLKHDPEAPTIQLPPTEVSTSTSVTQSLLSIQKALKQINNRLTNYFLFLKGKDQIYEAVAEAISKAKRKIRIVRLGSRPIAPRAVLKALAKKVKAGKAYEIVIVLDPSKPIGGFEDGHDFLMNELGEKEGADAPYKPLVLVTNEPICFDTIIVDNEHVGIGFTHTAGQEELQDAMMFHSPKVARHFVDWFDGVIKGNPNTGSYYDWKKRDKH
jgi:hypothetical protein